MLTRAYNTYRIRNVNKIFWNINMSYDIRVRRNSNQSEGSEPLNLLQSKKVIEDIKKMAYSIPALSKLDPTNIDILSMISENILNKKSKSILENLYTLAMTSIKRLSDSEFKMKHHFLINIAILRLYAHLQNNSQRQLEYLSNVAINDNLYSHVFHFAKYSKMVYFDNPEDSHSIPQSCIIYSNIHNRKNNHTTQTINPQSTLYIDITPRYCIFLDHLSQSIVITFRGTASAVDMVTNAQFDTIEFQQYLTSTQSMTCNSNTIPVLVHRGMGEAVLSILPVIESAISRAREMKDMAYRSYGITITGHSMGAGFAALVAMLLANSNNKMNTNYVINAYLFAPPPMITSSYLKVWDNKNICNIYAFVHHNDVIPRLSQYEFLRFMNSLVAIDGLHYTSQERRDILIKGELSKEFHFAINEAIFNREKQKSTSSSRATNQPNMQEASKLIVPGDIYILRPNKISKQMKEDTSNRTTNKSSEQNFTEKATNSFNRFIKFKESASTTNTSTTSNKEPIPELATGYHLTKLLDHEKLYSGFLLTGDSMFFDHSISQYIAALSELEVDIK